MQAVKRSARGITQWISPFFMNQMRPVQPSIFFVVSQRQYPSTLLSVALLRTSCLHHASIQIVNNSQSIPSGGLDRLSSESGTEEQNSHETDELDVLYHMIEIEIRCGDPAVLQSYNTFITTAARHLDLTLGLCEVGEKPHKKRWTVLKSVFGHKKHMVQYEVRTYHHRLSILRVTGSTADTFLEYIQRNLPEGVAMRVGRVRMEKLPEHLLTPPPSEEVDSNLSAASTEVNEEGKRKE